MCSPQKQAAANPPSTQLETLVDLLRTLIFLEAEGETVEEAPETLMMRAVSGETTKVYDGRNTPIPTVQSIANLKVMHVGSTMNVPNHKSSRCLMRPLPWASLANSSPIHTQTTGSAGLTNHLLARNVIHLGCTKNPCALGHWESSSSFGPVVQFALSTW